MDEKHCPAHAGFEKDLEHLRELYDTMRSDINKRLDDIEGVTLREIAKQLSNVDRKVTIIFAIGGVIQFIVVMIANGFLKF